MSCVGKPESLLSLNQLKLNLLEVETLEASTEPLSQNHDNSDVNPKRHNEESSKNYL